MPGVTAAILWSWGEGQENSKDYDSEPLNSEDADTNLESLAQGFLK